MFPAAFLRGQAHAPLPRPPVEAPLDVAFLDRDGTLNVLRPGYRTVADLDLLDGAAEAVARLNAVGVPVVLVTNQQGLGTGRLTWADLEDAHRLLCEQLARVGAHLDDIRICPHRAGTCGCRKPLPGLLRAVLDDNSWVDPARCLMIGDADSDSLAADAVGVPSRRIDADLSLADVVDTCLAERIRSSLRFRESDHMTPRRPATVS